MSVLKAEAVYMFGTTRGEAAQVPAKLAEGVVGERDGYTFSVRAPDMTNGNMILERATPSMFCFEFTVSVFREVSEDALDADEAIELTARIAIDVMTALIRVQPNLGFPGVRVPRVRYSATIDGLSAKLDTSRHSDPYSVLWVHQNIVSLEAIREAATGSTPPSRAETLALEAHYQVMSNPRASEVTAIVVAASACEVAIHECVRATARNADLNRLVNAIIPGDSQAKLSPMQILDAVLPVLTGRRLSDEDSNLQGLVTKLFKARDLGVHTGRLKPGTKAMLLVTAGRALVRWLEAIPELSEVSQ